MRLIYTPVASSFKKYSSPVYLLIVIVVYHSTNVIFAANNDYHALRTGYCGVKQVPCHQHRRTAYQWDNDNRIFASLAFMYRYFVGVFKLLGLRKIIFTNFAVI